MKLIFLYCANLPVAPALLFNFDSLYFSKTKMTKVCENVECPRAMWSVLLYVELCWPANDRHINLPELTKDQRLAEPAKKSPPMYKAHGPQGILVPRTSNDIT